MIPLTVRLDVAAAVQGLRATHDALEHHLGFALDRIGLEGVRVARREAPKFQSLLTNSIHYERRPGEVEIAPGERYAVFVHEGTRPGYMPPPSALMEYVKARAGVSLRNTRAGGATRAAQADEIRDRAWRLARYIYGHGTKANPFMARTAEIMAKRAPEILEAQMAKLAAEAGRA